MKTKSRPAAPLPRQLATEAQQTRLNGRAAVVQVPVIPADAGPILREGLRRRRLAGVLGWCPCGARRTGTVTPLQDAAAAQNAAHVPVPHTSRCQAHDDVLGLEIGLWQQQNGDRRGAQAR